MPLTWNEQLKKRKGDFVRKSLQYLSLKPELLKSVEYDQQFHDRILSIAENLYMVDPREELY